jgi:hypothetical protein
MGQGKPVGDVLETSMETIYKGAQPSERQELRDIEPKYPNICVCACSHLVTQVGALSNKDENFALTR